MLPTVDLHAAYAKETNTRVTDITTGKPLTNRFGVNLHWTVPRHYRVSAASGRSDAEEERKRRMDAGFPTPVSDRPGEPRFDPASPEQRYAPNRWLVIRRLDKESILQRGVRGNVATISKTVRAWVVESDAVLDLDKIPTDDSAEGDMAAQMAPFIDTAVTNDKNTLKHQASVFIGRKTDAGAWTEAQASKSNSVPLCLHLSSNPLFADYTPRNANVFSMLDDFSDVGTGILTAKASYLVLGWHANVDQDPLHRIQQATLQSVLDSCKLRLVPELKEQAEVQDNFRTLCHGSMHDVIFSSKQQYSNTPAKAMVTDMAERTPFSVGTSAMDAMLAWAKEQIATWPDPETRRQYQALFANLSSLRSTFASDLAAQDDSATHPISGGKAWFFSGDKGNVDTINKPDLSDEDRQSHNLAQERLNKINELQTRIDGAAHALQYEQHELFSMWWIACSEDKSNPDVVSEQTARIKQLSDDHAAWTKELAEKLNPSDPNAAPVEARARPQFQRPKDPTLFVAGVGPSWPTDYLQPLLVRFNPDYDGLCSSIAALQSPARPIQDFDDFIKGNLARPDWFTRTGQGTAGDETDSMDQAVKVMLAEFFGSDLDTQHQETVSGLDTILQKLGPALYQDKCATSGLPRNRWNDSQPWLPLFIEWEAQYRHIPSEDWSSPAVEKKDGTHPTSKVLRWSTKEAPQAPGTDPAEQDIQTCSGRIIIQPQPGFSLRRSVEHALSLMSVEDQRQLLTSLLPPEELKKLTPEQVRDHLTSLLDKMNRLPYMSAPLSGLHTQLATRLQGMHVKPSMHPPGRSISALQAAILGSFDARTIEMMGLETDTTPFGREVNVSRNNAFSPLKSVVHGHLQLTKLNIVDKFGQAIGALDHQDEKKSAAMCPVISDFYAPRYDPVAPGTIQMPPTINQDVRLNADFMLWDTTNSIWRPATVWEDPIEGWVIFNYVEEALQFFLPDGTFYREVRRGSGEGARWLPFDASELKASDKAAIGMLETFIAHLSADSPGSGASNLEQFMEALYEACDRLPHASSEYADFMAAIIGRPLALVNIGISLELATPPQKNQSLLNTNGPSKPLTEYEFQVRLGSYSESDGLVAVLDEGGAPTSYFPQPDSVGPIEPVPLKPFFLDPSGEDFCAKLNEKLERRAVIIDPFTDLHVITGIVPTLKLRLPGWTIHSALRRMTAFFQMGPILTTAREQPFNPNALPKTSDVAYLDALIPPSVEHGKGIAIPALQTADWNWLQPYQVDLFNAIGIERLDNKPGFQTGPYTALHGYLQMKTSLDIDK